MNLDYRAGLAVDGIWGTKSRQALGNHYVRRGEKQYLVTAAEILLMLKNYAVNGVESPGIFGSGLEQAVKKLSESRRTFRGRHRRTGNFPVADRLIFENPGCCAGKQEV